MATTLDLLARLTDNASVRRVYSEPYERDGVTIALLTLAGVVRARRRSRRPG